MLASDIDSDDVVVVREDARDNQIALSVRWKFRFVSFQYKNRSNLEVKLPHNLKAYLMSSVLKFGA